MNDDLDDLLNSIKTIKTKTVENEQSADHVETAAKLQLIRDGKTRSTLTLVFLLGFFGMLIFACLFVFAYNWAAVNWNIDLKAANVLQDSEGIPLLELDKILSVIIGALGTSLGFIIGYYFKDKK